MTPPKEKTQVFSRHLTGKKASENLSKFSELLSGMMRTDESKPEALGDITVVELGEGSFPGIITGSMLGEYGATVIKVEPPEGDPARKITPHGANVDGIGLPFLMESRNKSFITADLKTESGRENLKKLLSKADLVIDAFRPAELDALGLGYRQLSKENPGLVYVAVSPYGHYTAKAKEFRNVPDSDLTAQAEAGYPSLTGNPEAPEPYNYPLKAGIWAGWYVAAALATAGALTALFHKRRTGEGQIVDIATHDAITVWQGISIVWGFTARMPRVRVGNFDWGAFPYGYFQAKDGYVTVASAQDADFRGLLKILGRWDLEGDWRFLFDRITDDVTKLKTLEDELKKEFAKHTRKELVRKTLDYSAKAARDRLRSKGSPIVVETKSPSEVREEEHWKVRNTFVSIDDAKIGKFTIPTAIPRMSETPPRVKWIKRGIGEDNDQVYAKYGLVK